MYFFLVYSKIYWCNTICVYCVYHNLFYLIPIATIFVSIIVIIRTKIFYWTSITLLVITQKYCITQLIFTRSKLIHVITYVYKKITLIFLFDKYYYRHNNRDKFIYLNHYLTTKYRKLIKDSLKYINLKFKK